MKIILGKNSLTKRLRANCFEPLSNGEMLKVRGGDRNKPKTKPKDFFDDEEEFDEEESVDSGLMVASVLTLKIKTSTKKKDKKHKKS